MTLNFRETLPVWWSFVWRAAIYGALLGLVLGFFGGLIAAINGLPQHGAIYGAIAGYIGTIPASMLALKHALSKHLVSLGSLAGQRA